MKIEGRSDADHRDPRETASMGVHPLLLLWRADANEDDIGISRADQILNGEVFLPGQSAKWRRIGADDRDSGKSHTKALAKDVESIFTAAVKKDTITGLRRVAADFQHQGRSVNALLFTHPK